LWYKNKTTKKTISSQEIILDGKTVAYTLIVKERVRNMRITINREGHLKVTIPHHLHEEATHKFLQSKAGWILSKMEYLLLLPKISPPTSKELHTYKEKALTLALEKIHTFNSMYNFTYNNVRIKNQKTLWGSCSRKGNLNFNYKIACIPEEFVDYIIVHELCHLGEFNHSKRFWDLVSKSIPDYKNIRRQMRAMTMVLP